MQIILLIFFVFYVFLCVLSKKNTFFSTFLPENLHGSEKSITFAARMEGMVSREGYDANRPS